MNPRMHWALVFVGVALMVLAAALLIVLSIP